jgi:assimilatory nitrate reductase catalytic subunit
MPDQALVRRALERCPLVIVQDAYATTATTAHADILLPASSWAEKAGTVTNSERRISRVRTAVPAPGEARHDWRIAVDVGRRLEARGLGRRGDGGSLFGFDDPADIWLAHRETTRGRDLDITGLTLDRLDRGPVQWPCLEGADDGVPRLYSDGRFATPDGRARFAAPAARGVADACDDGFPVALTTGRLRDQWHGSSRTGTLGRLFAHEPEPAVDLHPQDMVLRGWPDGSLLQVQSRRGRLVLPARASAAVAPGQAFVAMHWGPEALAGQGVNALMPAVVCPQSKQPELKHAAVQLSPADLPWRLVAAAWLPADEALLVREQLKTLFDGFAYATCVPFGREELAPVAGEAAAPPRVGLLWRAAAVAPDLPALARIEALLGLVQAPAMRYADTRGGQHRTVELDGQGRLRGFLLGGTAASAGWLLDLLQTGASAAALGRSLLADAAQPPIAQAPRARQLCACHDVDEARACAALQAAPGDAKARISVVQATLRCGTGCGSCLPALQTLARAAVAASPATVQPPAAVALT